MYSAIQAVRDDCAEKALATKKYCDDLTIDVISPLKELLHSQTKPEKDIEASWRRNREEMEERKKALGEAKERYARAFEILDREMASYEKSTKENKDLREEKRRRLAENINFALVSCAQSENNYKQVFNKTKMFMVDNTSATVP